MKLMILPIALLMTIAPSAISLGPSPQTRAEQLIRGFLSQHGPYMAIYFSDIDTAFYPIYDYPPFMELSKKTLAYQDSTMMFSHTDVAKADSFYEIYKKLNLKKDSMRIHYTPQPMGYLLIHHYQLEGKPWTDSFVVDFNIEHILKIKETIE